MEPIESIEPTSSKETPEIKHLLPLQQEWVWKSDLSAVNAYEAQFVALLKNTENSWLDEDAVDLCSLGFREALANAIKYGNASDPLRRVRVEITMDDHAFSVSLADENPVRFNADTAFDSVKDEAEKLAFHGRGLTIMRTAYPAGVSFEFMDPGNKVTMCIQRESK